MFRLIPFIVLLSLVFSSFNLSAQNEDIELYMPGKIAKLGDIVNIDLKVNGFKSIIACQASLNWDPALVKYKGVSNFGLNDLGINNFGTNKADLGHLRFAWDPSDALPVTMADSSVLFTVQFEVVANQSQQISIGFSDIISSPAYINEFANSNYDALELKTYEGVVKAVADLAELVQIKTQANNSCDEKNPLGNLKASVDDDSLTYTFRWFKGNVTKETADYVGYRIEHLPGGEYTLQILDAQQAIFVESMTAIVADESNYQSDQITLVEKTDQTSCSLLPGKQTGALEIEINGAQAPDGFNISWWKGDIEDNLELSGFKNSFKASQLPAGSYVVAIENKTTACKSYLQESVLSVPVNLQMTVSSTPNNFCKDGKNGTASANITEPAQHDARYYWFDDADAIDTTQAMQKGPLASGLAEGIYKVWVIDLATDCHVQGNITVHKEELYDAAAITLDGTTLLASDERANWFRDNIFLQKTGASLEPEESGYYTITVRNDFNCLSKSEPVYFGITGLEETIIEGISIFPNPFAESFSIANQRANLDFVHVFDTRGRLLYQNSNINKQFIEVYLNGSLDGIYLVKIGIDGKTYTSKVLQNISK